MTLEQHLEIIKRRFEIQNNQTFYLYFKLIAKLESGREVILTDIDGEHDEFVEAIGFAKKIKAIYVTATYYSYNEKTDEIEETGSERIYLQPEKEPAAEGD